MSKPEVTGRIMDLLKGFDKIKDVSKVILHLKILVESRLMDIQARRSVQLHE